MNARSRRIVVRLEFGGALGWGHLARCSALAAELRGRGWTCVAWTDGDLATAPDDLRAPFAEVRGARAGPGAADWIVVDHYGVSDTELREMRQAAPGARLLVIDDEAARALDAADVVVNARLGLETAPYACARSLLGVRYALLRGGLRHPAAIPSPVPSDISLVLVVLGGTDPRGIAAEALHGLADVDPRRLAPVLIRSRTLAGGEHVTRALGRFSQHVWVERVDATELAGWAGICRLAISACGGTLFELALVGLPFVGVIVADNQLALARVVEARWHLPIVDAPGNERIAIAAGLRRLLAAPAAARSPFGGIDGLGAARLADVIEEMTR